MSETIIRSCYVCGVRVKASFKVNSLYPCRRHLSTAVEATAAKGDGVLVERLR